MQKAGFLLTQLRYESTVRSPGICGPVSCLLCSDQVRHKPACTGTEDSKILEISKLETQTIVFGKTDQSVHMIFAFVFHICNTAHNSNFVGVHIFRILSFIILEIFLIETYIM